MSTNHQTQILAHLKTCKTLSQAEAISLFNCYRLSAVIKRLRNAGYEIITYNESNQNRDGYHARYEYRELEA